MFANSTIVLMLLIDLLCAIAQQSYSRHAGIRRPSIKPLYSEIVKRIKAKFWGKSTCPPHLQTILLFFKIYIFFFILYDF